MRIVVYPVLAATLFAAACTQSGNGNGNAYLADGAQAISEGRYAAAEQHFAAILQENPMDPYAHLNIGVAKANQGRKAEAADHYRKAIETGGTLPVRSLVQYHAGGTANETVAQVATRNLQNL